MSEGPFRQWYLTQYGNTLHYPMPWWPISKGGPLAHGLCGAKLAPHRPTDPQEHRRCEKCETALHHYHLEEQ